MSKSKTSNSTGETGKTNGETENTNGKVHDNTTKVTKTKKDKKKKDGEKKDMKTNGEKANGTKTDGKKKEDDMEIDDDVGTDLNDLGEDDSDVTDLTDISMADDDLNGTTVGAPKRWVDDEPDIDEDDVEAQITRCQERIIEGKMQEYYGDKLKMLVKKKLHRDDTMARWPKMSFQVAKRLDFFKGLKEHLHENGDKHKVRSTIEAIMKQYLTKNLDWVPGSVTYWSYGKQLTQPKPFDWDEFLDLNTEYEGWSGFWVEGVPIALRIIRRPVHSGEMGNTTIDPNWNRDEHRPTLHQMRYRQSRVPLNPVDDDDDPLAGSQPPIRPLILPGPLQSTYYDPQDPHEHQIIWMNDDTGSDICTLNQSDIDSLVLKAQEQHEDAELPPLLGYIQTWVGGKTFYEVARTLQINLRGGDGKLMMKKWDNIEVAIAEDDADPQIYEPIRLIGPWLRHRFYTATSPDGTNRLYIVKKMRRLFHLNHVNIGYSGLLPGLTVTQTMGRDEIAASGGHMRRRRQTVPPADS
ncbi:uncharacterized protein N7483_009034 [Penicillium malachiteum]|uniref:uncharacterized protein n=1 Tax=Penicillium malachiteum TaxID=1324776 RepID=UPI00254856B5|nr:uncharacterized protein N7483_009034 [Penicillium malachiteum]KAJ5721100.1 hypothetical protein N7483_009034 [Penicillium malachiteum]